MARSALLILALAGLVGCVSLRQEIERRFFATQLELTFDRPRDLVPPEGLRVTSTANRQIVLNWSPVLVDAVAGYAVMRSKEAGGPWSLVGRTLSRFETIYTDDAGGAKDRLGDGVTYHYRVHPFDHLGKVSRSHAYVMATTDPPPAAPQGLHVYSSLPRRVVVAWTASPQESVAGYAVLRSPTTAGPWERVGFVHGRLYTVYEDSVPGDLRVMYYRLVAVNAFGGESEPTEPIQAVTKAEPLPPLGLEAQPAAIGAIELRWRPNVEEDLAAYEVWRATRAPDGEWTEEIRIAEVKASETGMRDARVGCGEAVRYRLRAVDGDLLVSDFSDPVEAAGPSLAPRIEPGAEGPALRWDPERARPWTHARVLRRRPLAPDPVVSEGPSTGPVSLAGLPPGVHDLVVELGTDSQAAPSCEVRVELP